MRYRVVQWATGNLGRPAIEGIVSHPELELVGVWVHSAAKIGQDAGALADRPDLETGVQATNDVDALIALAPDCILYSPLVPIEDELLRFLSAGINVVTPLGWFYPRDLETTAIEAACNEGNSTLHGTGIHPGGVTEKWPLMMSSFSRDVTYVSCEEYSDCRTYGSADVLRDIMLFGKTPQEAKDSFMLQLLGSGFGQSVHMLADSLGFTLDGPLRATHDFALATAPIDTPMGIINPGLIAAQRFRWEGLQQGEPVVKAEVNWYMGTDNIETDWFDARKIAQSGECFAMRVEGDPPVYTATHGVHPSRDMDWSEVHRRNPGMVATAMHCVNSIPFVCKATTGIKTYLDLPIVHGKAKVM
ncbi:dihydrodipicolinate reductase [Halioglobus maricola]|uniref:Dihydrodipicolinate reductase n=1 Tax=Halioglobus maricola TaxID=2601894 RepID=A0A5P9NFT6_9GAMM|nr:dihydrodipicolinate reductase [Halioglobus maricola]QFU74369.1 dihydrodipicolinate reductase [Halioglobus maricola]